MALSPKNFYFPKNNANFYSLISQEGNASKVKALVKSGQLQITNQDPQLAISFQEAVRNNDIEIVKYLLYEGYSPNYIHERHGSPLETAALYGLTNMIRLLVKFGADINIVSSHGYNALAQTVWHIEQEAVKTAKLLISLGININLANDLGRTPLHSAMIEGNINLIEILVENGAELFAKDKYGKLPLEYLKPGTKLSSNIMEKFAQSNIGQER